MNKQERVKGLVKEAGEQGLLETLYMNFGKSPKIKIPFTSSDCNLEIEELNLSVRSNNALRRKGILTIGQLIDQLNQGTVKGTRNLGIKSYAEIQTKILSFGYERSSERTKEQFFENLLEVNYVVGY